MNTSTFIVDSINLSIAGNEGMHESLNEFEFRSDTNTRVICPCTSEKLMYNVVSTLSPLFFDRIFFIFAVKEDNHKVLDEFEI